MVQLLLPFKYSQRFRMPSAVLEIINLAIAMHWDGQKAIIPRHTLRSLIASRMHVDRRELSLYGWASSDRIKIVYEPLGWSVLFFEDKAPIEPGKKRLPPIFIFSKAEETSQDAKDRTTRIFREGVDLRE